MANDYIDHIEDKVTGEDISLETSVQATTQFIFDLCHPVHELYYQLPGMPEPMTLYNVYGITTTWVKRDYNGAFFRAEGGLAQAFEDQEEPQAESVPNITGNTGVANVETSYLSGAFKKGDSTSYNVTSNPNSGSKINALNASLSNAAYGRRNEVAPKNYTIAIWERTA